MAELKLVAPLLSNMEVVECLSECGGTSVYIVKSTKSQQEYVLKHISIPESQTQVDALRYTGAAATDEEAQKYYEQVVTDLKTELETLESLSSSPNLEAFRSYQICPKEDAIGYDVYLLAERRTSLEQYLSENAVTHACAINLGMDLCNALLDLRNAELIHRDIKPSNIFLNNQGHFVIGDLGIAKIPELKFCSMPENMLSAYSAPELFNLMGTIGTTVDIYSVGQILYRLFNGNHAAFEDEKTSVKEADQKRISGEELPTPMYADYEISSIIMKACSFNPEDRYATPEEFRQELMQYMLRNQVEETLIAPPIVSDPEETIAPEEEDEPQPVQFADAGEMEEDFKESFSPDTDRVSSIIEDVRREEEKDAAAGRIHNSLEPQEDDTAVEEGPSSTPKKKKTKRKVHVLPLVLAILAVLVLAAGAVYHFVLAPQRVVIDQLEVLESTADSVSVRVHSKEESGRFQVECRDAYGNVTTQDYEQGQENTFEDLSSGTQYTISIIPADGCEVTGESTAMASTFPVTNVLSLTTTPISVTQAELNLTVSGDDPGEWTVLYYADGAESKTMTFTGHSAVIANLKSGTEYTFELQQPEGRVLTGALSTEFSTVPTVDIDHITAALSSSSAILSWSITGTAPEEWTVTVSGPDGYTDTQTVTTPSATLEGLSAGVTYDISISAVTMLQTVNTSITPTITKLTDLSAKEDNGNMVISWGCEADPAEDAWVLTCEVKDSKAIETKTLEVENVHEVTLDSADLCPGVDYLLTLTMANGERVDGTNTVTFHTPDAEDFRDYGFKGVYVVTYLCPTNENWTYLNLATKRETYAPDEAVAFAAQTVGKLDSSDEVVTVLYKVTDKNGKLVSIHSEEKVWNDMWTKSIFAGALEETPQKAGDYTMDVYFNNKLAFTKEFKVK